MGTVWRKMANDVLLPWQAFMASLLRREDKLLPNMTFFPCSIFNSGKVSNQL